MSNETLAVPEWFTQFCSTEPRREPLLAPLCYTLATGERVTLATPATR